MERSRTDGGEKAALLMGADAAEADDGPALAATGAKSDESSPSVASGNAFARLVVCTEMGEKVGPRLRELASRSRRKLGGGIHAT